MGFVVQVREGVPEITELARAGFHQRADAERQLDAYREYAALGLFIVSDRTVRIRLAWGDAAAEAHLRANGNDLPEIVPGGILTVGAHGCIRPLVLAEDGAMTRAAIIAVTQDGKAAIRHSLNGYEPVSSVLKPAPTADLRPGDPMPNWGSPGGYLPDRTWNHLLATVREVRETGAVPHPRSGGHWPHITAA